MITVYNGDDFKSLKVIFRDITENYQDSFIDFLSGRRDELINDVIVEFIDTYGENFDIFLYGNNLILISKRGQYDI